METAGLTRRGLLALAAIASTSPLIGSISAADKIFLRSVGDGERAWLLLHPYSASGRFWEARAAALATQHKVRVLSPDLPSHGRSQIVDRFDYDLSCDAMAIALAPYRNDIAAVIGASSGGVVALKLAARWNKPVAAIGVGKSFSVSNLDAMRALSRSLPPGAEQFINAFLEQGAAQRSAMMRHYADLASLGSEPLLTESEAAALGGRTLIVNGSADAFFSRQSAEALADSIPASLLTFVTGADHLGPLAAPHRDLSWAQIASFMAVRQA